MSQPWLEQPSETKPPSNESTTLTLKPLRVDRAPALRGAGLFAVALEAWVWLNCSPLVVHTSEPRNVSQKPSPSPAVRDAPTAICRPNSDELDRTPPIAARAPEVSL